MNCLIVCNIAPVCILFDWLIDFDCRITEFTRDTHINIFFSPFERVSHVWPTLSTITVTLLRVLRWILILRSEWKRNIRHFSYKFYLKEIFSLFLFLSSRFYGIGAEIVEFFFSCFENFYQFRILYRNSYEQWSCLCEFHRFDEKMPRCCGAPLVSAAGGNGSPQSLGLQIQDG